MPFTENLSIMTKYLTSNESHVEPSIDWCHEYKIQVSYPKILRDHKMKTVEKSLGHILNNLDTLFSRSRGILSH